MKFSQKSLIFILFFDLFLGIETAILVWICFLESSATNSWTESIFCFGFLIMSFIYCKGWFVAMILMKTFISELKILNLAFGRVFNEVDRKPSSLNRNKVVRQILQANIDQYNELLECLDGIRTYLNSCFLFQTFINATSLAVQCYLLVLFIENHLLLATAHRFSLILITCFELFFFCRLVDEINEMVTTKYLFNRISI